MPEILRRKGPAVAQEVIDLGKRIGEPLAALLHQGCQGLQALPGAGPVEQPVQEVLGPHLAQVLAVHPVQLLEVEHRAAQDDAGRVEGLQELLAAEDGLLVGHGPAHAGQIVDQGLRQVALLPVVVDACGVPALGELAAVRVAQQRQVNQLRQFPAEPVAQQPVLGHGGNPFLAAHDMRDAHPLIIHHRRQMIGGHPVRLEQHLHVDLAEGNFDCAAQFVPEPADALLGHLHAHHPRLAAGKTLRQILRGQPQAMAIVAGSLPRRPLSRPQFGQPLGRAEAVEGMAGLQQPIDMLAIERLALALPIGRMGAADIRPLVPLDAKPSQGIQNRPLRSRRAARRIRILDADDELPAPAFGQGPVEQSGIGRAQMGRAGGRGSDAGANGHGRRIIAIATQGSPMPRREAGPG